MLTSLLLAVLVAEGGQGSDARPMPKEEADATELTPATDIPPTRQPLLPVPPEDMLSFHLIPDEISTSELAALLMYCLPPGKLVRWRDDWSHVLVSYPGGVTKEGFEQAYLMAEALDAVEYAGKLPLTVECPKIERSSSAQPAK